MIKSEHNAQAQEDGSYNTHVTLPDNAKYKVIEEELEIGVVCVCCLYPTSKKTLRIMSLTSLPNVIFFSFLSSCPQMMTQ